MKEKYIICIGTGKMQLSVIEAIKKQGYKVIGVDRNAESPGARKCDIFINESTYDYKSIIEKIEKIGKGKDIANIIVKSSGKPVVTAAKIAEKLKLEFPSVEAVEKSLDKLELKRFMGKLGVRCPRNFNIEEAEYPLVIKPKIGLESKKNIFLIYTKEELKFMEEELGLNSDNYILEEYIEGSDCVFFGAIEKQRIKYYTILDELNDFNDSVGTIGSKKLKGRGFSIPSAYMGAEAENDILNESRKVIKNLGISRGIIWISYRIKENKSYLIEIHLDLAGEFILDKLMSYYAKTNCIEEVIKLYAGEESFDIKHFEDSYTIVFRELEIELKDEDLDVLERGKFTNELDFVIAKNK